MTDNSPVRILNKQMDQEVTDEVQNILVTALKDTAIEGRVMLVYFRVVTHTCT